MRRSNQPHRKLARRRGALLRLTEYAKSYGNKTLPAWLLRNMAALKDTLGVT